MLLLRPNSRHSRLRHNATALNIQIDNFCIHFTISLWYRFTVLTLHPSSYFVFSFTVNRRKNSRLQNSEMKANYMFSNWYLPIMFKLIAVFSDFPQIVNLILLEIERSSFESLHFTPIKHFSKKCVLAVDFSFCNQIWAFRWYAEHSRDIPHKQITR